MKKHLLKGLMFAPLMLIGFSASAQSNNGIPQFNSEAEKLEWIKQHPAEYAQAQKPAETVSTGTTLGTTANLPTGQYVVADGFPQYVNTGNKQHDDDVYAAAKQVWISQHQEQYEQMTSGNDPK